MGVSPGQNLSLAALGQIEAAVVGLLAAVKGAKAVVFSDPHTPPAGPIVADSLNEFLLTNARSWRAMSYVVQLHTHQARFARGIKGEVLVSVTSVSIERWLYGQG